MRKKDTYIKCLLTSKTKFSPLDNQLVTIMGLCAQPNLAHDRDSQWCHAALSANNTQARGRRSRRERPPLTYYRVLFLVSFARACARARVLSFQFLCLYPCIGSSVRYSSVGASCPSFLDRLVLFCVLMHQHLRLFVDDSVVPSF